jgi:hypothetical protein
MSFRLRNTGATYQQAIQLCLADQLHRNVEGYVDDMVIKNRAHDEFIPDLKETFTAFARSGGRSTQPSVSLMYHKGNYSGSSLVTEGLKPTRRTSPPLQTWLPHGRSRMSRSSQAVWWLRIDLSCDLKNKVTLLQIAQMTRQVSVDRGGEAGAQKSQASFAVSHNLDGSTTSREPVTLYRDYSHH